MLRKDPDNRPTVQQLLALPSLQRAVAEARRLARTIQPDVYLPPMAQVRACAGAQCAHFCGRCQGHSVRATAAVAKGTVCVGSALAVHRFFANVLQGGECTWCAY